MIEVEQKFLLNPEQEAQLIEGAELISEVSFSDTYFDSADMSLGLKDTWLRDRGGRYELKVPFTRITSEGGSYVDRYREIEDEDEVAEYLGLNAVDKGIGAVLEAAGYLPIATYETTRRKYGRDGFIIDLDVTDFGFAIAEIELLVAREEEVEMAIGKIAAFATRFNLKVVRVRGKLIEYLLRNDPEKYKLLVAGGIVKES